MYAHDHAHIHTRNTTATSRGLWNIIEETWGLFPIIETGKFLNNVQSSYLRHGLRRVKKFTGNN